MSKKVKTFKNQNPNAQRWDSSDMNAEDVCCCAIPCFTWDITTACPFFASFFEKGMRGESVQGAKTMNIKLGWVNQGRLALRWRS